MSVKNSNRAQGTGHIEHSTGNKVRLAKGTPTNAHVLKHYARRILTSLPITVPVGLSGFVITIIFGVGTASS